MKNKANKNFQIRSGKFGNQLLLKLFNSKTGESVSLLPETGGMLHSLKLLIGGKFVSILDCYLDENELKRELGNSFKGSNLFPFPNRVAGGKYEFGFRKHQLSVNFPQENNSIHGLIFDKLFKVVESKTSDRKANVKLRFDSDGNLIGYPFCFRLDVEFIFEESKGLAVTTAFTNTDSVNIPVANGWHPYFRLQSKVDDLILSFPTEKVYKVDNRMIPTGECLNYSDFKKPKQLGKTAFDTCFALNDRENKAIITVNDPALKGGVLIWQETGKEKFNLTGPPKRSCRKRFLISG